MKFAVSWTILVGALTSVYAVPSTKDARGAFSLLGTPRATLFWHPRATLWQRIPRGGSDVPLPTPPEAGIPVPPSPDATEAKLVDQVPPPSQETAPPPPPESTESVVSETTATTTESSDVSASAISLGTIASQAVKELGTSLKGGKADTLLLLGVTALVPTICAMVKVSPILGFLVSGLALGPQGLNLVADLHTTELLADLGVVLFLFEMGVHLSLKTLWDMRSIVFGLGGAQMALTAAAVASVARACGLGLAAQVVLGGGLGLSSSAFVLQLLKDKKELETVKGKHSFGVLLLQDLAVVPLLVVTPLLAGGDGQKSVKTAVVTAVVQLVMALAAIGIFGTFIMPYLFNAVLGLSQSQEATIAVGLVTILGMSFLTQGLGLSNTLGAFLAGVLLSETPFRHTIEHEVSPFRGILVGLFFFSVGFELDLPLLFSREVKKIAAIVGGLMTAKTIITTLLCTLFGLELSTSQQVGFLLSQGGEFGFVAFRLARSLGIFDEHLTKLMLTSVSLTMALTPLMEGLGSMIASKMVKASKLA